MRLVISSAVTERTRRATRPDLLAHRASLVGEHSNATVPDPLLTVPPVQAGEIATLMV
jgi:hypothetical protein